MVVFHAGFAEGKDTGKGGDVTSTVTPTGSSGESTGEGGGAFRFQALGWVMAYAVASGGGADGTSGAGKSVPGSGGDSARGQGCRPTSGSSGTSASTVCVQALSWILAVI